MYYRTGTDGRCCIGAGKRFVLTRQVAALCHVKLRHGLHLVIRNPPMSIDAHLLAEHS